MRRSTASIVAALCLAGPALAAPASVDAMRDMRRVLLVSAPASDSPRLQSQRSAIAQWSGGADERDLTVVQIVGDKVQGASDAADTLRARYDLPAGTFTATLVGKDGHVALRSTEPLSGSVLGKTIDAMPMRRAGQR